MSPHNNIKTLMLLCGIKPISLVATQFHLQRALGKTRVQKPWLYSKMANEMHRKRKGKQTGWMDGAV